MRQFAWIYPLVALIVLCLSAPVQAQAAPVCEFEGVDGAGNYLSCGSSATGSSDAGALNWNNYFRQRPSPERRAVKSIAKAEKAQAAGKYASAIAHYRAALQHAEVAPLRIALGQVYILNGDYEQGIRECRRTDELPIWAGFCEAWGTYWSGDLQQAKMRFGRMNTNLAYAEQALSNGSNIDTYFPHMSTDQAKELAYVIKYMHGSLLYKTSDYVKSLSTFRNALAWKPGDRSALIGVTMAAQKAERWSSAEWALRKLYEQSPKDEWIVDDLARALSYQKKHSEAESFYEKAVRLNPKNDHYHSQQSSAEYWQDKFEEAEQSAKRAYKLKPDNWHARQIGEALVKQGKHEEAISHFETAVRLAPADKFNQKALDQARAAVAHGQIGTKGEAATVFDTTGSLMAGIPAVPVVAAPVDEGPAVPLPPGLAEDPEYRLILERRRRLESIRVEKKQEIEKTDQQLENGEIDKDQWSAKRSASKQDLNNLDVYIAGMKRKEQIVYNRYRGLSVTEQDQADEKQDQADTEAVAESGGSQ